ncbi:MAG: hypothetical protein ACFB0B_09320 [Thermonemataceae bacterium]
MELDALKTLWKEQQEAVQEEIKPIEAAQLLALLRQRSHSVVAKIKRNLLGEVILSLAIGVLFLAFIPSLSNTTLQITLTSFIVFFCSATSMVYLYFWRWIKSNYDLSDNLRAATQRLIFCMERAIKISLYCNMVLIPLGTTLGGLYGYALGGKPIDLYSNVSFTVTMVLILLFSILMAYPLHRLYINKLYRKHLKHLKAVLEEMN